MAIRSRGRAAALALVALIAGAPGCQGLREKRGMQVSQGTLNVVQNPVLLHGEIHKLLEDLYAGVVGASSTIAASTTDRTVRERSLRAKLRVGSLLQFIAHEPDPRQKFILTWVAAAQLRISATQGPTRDAFGDQQQVVVDLAHRFEQKILEIGRRHFGNELMEAARGEVEDLAGNYPLTGDLTSDLVSLKQYRASSITDDVTKILSTPFSITGIQGIADTPGAIREFNEVAAGFKEVIRTLPKQTRWETELLLLEVDSMETLVAARRDLERASKSMESLSKTAETLPADLRREVQEALRSVEATGEKLRSTVEAVRSAAQEIGTTLAQAERTALTTQQVAMPYIQAGEQWEATALAVRSILETFRELSVKEGETEPAKPEAEPVTARDYETMAIEIRAAATEVRGLLADLESGRVKSALVDTGTRIVDRALIGLGIFLGALVALAVILRGRKKAVS